MIVKKNPPATDDETAVATPPNSAVAEPKKPESRPSNAKPASTMGGFCVYLGPSIHGVIQSGAIFAGDKAGALASIKPAIETYPLIATLVVSEQTLAEDRVKVKTPGNLLNVHYGKLASGKKRK